MTRSNSAAAILQGEARVLEVIDKHTQVIKHAPICNLLPAVGLVARHGCCKVVDIYTQVIVAQPSVVGQLLLAVLPHSSYLSLEVRSRGTSPQLWPHVSLQIVMHSFQPGGLVGRLCAPREMCCVRSWRQVGAAGQGCSCMADCTAPATYFTRRAQHCMLEVPPTEAADGLNV